MNNTTKTQETCQYPEGHEAHMALNGECPWCGAYDPEAIDESLDVDDFG